MLLNSPLLASLAHGRRANVPIRLIRPRSKINVVPGFDAMFSNNVRWEITRTDFIYLKTRFLRVSDRHKRMRNVSQQQKVLIRPSARKQVIQRALTECSKMQ